MKTNDELMEDDMSAEPVVRPKKAPPQKKISKTNDELMEDDMSAEPVVRPQKKSLKGYNTGGAVRGTGLSTRTKKTKYF